MKTSDFDYSLPETFIAQTPIEPRDAARLLVLHRDGSAIEHRIFHEIGQYLRPNDVLVLNRTRVIPARIYGRKSTGGRVELLLLRRREALTWEVLVGGKGLSVGSSIQLEDAPKAQIVEILDGSERLVRFEEPIEPYLSRIGHVPLPPYIHTALNDPERYQTVYAQEPGSAAAPTAGLHFTPRLLDELEKQGVKLAFVMLHVGLDTFAPVTEDDPMGHRIHTEWCELSAQAAATINGTRTSGGRIVAVGTTSVRTLETAARGVPKGSQDRVAPFSGPTDLYILPGFEFKAVEAMFTNFHLPKSTLLMLVSAFAGREGILETYEIAKQEGYRFYSFGDAMLIL